jgi:hypothetical protein
MKIASSLVTLSFLIGCSTNTSSGGEPDASNSTGTGGGVSTGGGSSENGGSSAGGGGPATGGRKGNPASGGSSASSGGASSAGSSATGGGSSGGKGSGGQSSGGAWKAGNPDGMCAAGVPQEGRPADVATPATVVGTGTAASCTFDQLAAAVTKGGIITFDCGSAPVTIPVTATLKVPTGKDTVIDGNRLVTLDGQSKVRILSFDSPGWQTNEHRLTLQHLALINAKSTPTEAIPAAPSPCSQGWNDGQGGAVYMRDGNLTVIDSIFTGNQAAPLGPDTGGGAIYVQGSKHGVVVAGSTFAKNAAANAGALGGLFAELHVYDSLFEQNAAVGNGANNNDASKCSAMNNGQNEVGSGGNGAAIYQDGASATNVLLCGVDVESNKAGTGAFGGGVFMTSNDFSGTMTVRDSTITGNTGGSWTQVKEGSLNLGTAFGVNAKSGSVQNSTLQGR